jgi:hypothetical protein
VLATLDFANLGLTPIRELAPSHRSATRMVDVLATLDFANLGLTPIREVA